ncbi:MAG: hypothetical protein P1Q69_18395 [Candidatus Thorarchaeota archaeon]|nr:hypothetical protein [Candidatus Thorarchaeota archaeon]
MVSGYDLMECEGKSDLIVKITTEGRDQVYMMMVDAVPSGLAMVDYVQDIQA